METPIIPSQTRILEESERQVYWSRLQELWNIPKHTKHFPGSHPVPVNSDNVKKIKNDEFVVALKTDGIRYLLFLTVQPHSENPIALMIDRTLLMYEICVWANYDFFQYGTLFDGELAWNILDGFSNNTLSYCVFDVIAVSGKRMTMQPFSERLQVIHDSLFRAWKPMNNEELETYVQDENKIVCQHRDPYSIIFHPKPCFPQSQTLEIWEGRFASQQRADGLLFTSRHSPMAFGRTESMLKWKEHNTIDIALSKQDEIYQVWLDSKKIPKAQGKRKVQKKEIIINRNKFEDLVDNVIVQIEENSTLMDKIGSKSSVFECSVTSFIDNVLKLFPIRHRFDKAETNSASTILSTITMNQVSIDDICNQ